MKNNFGIFFHILFGVTTLSFGVYFFKSILFLSLIFFVATIVNILLIYREYDIQNHVVAKVSAQIIQEEVQIRNSKSILLSNCSGYLIFIIISLFFLNLISKIETESLIVFAIMPIGAIIFSLIMLFSEIKKMYSIAIKINRKGIQIFRRLLIKWEDIENEKIISRIFSSRQSIHDFKSTVNYLQFYSKDKKIEIEINDLDVTDYELSNYLTTYRKKFDEEKLN